MRHRNRRRWDVVWLALVAVTAGAAATIAALTADNEHVAMLWTQARLDDGGGASITEVVDYDFGSRSRHGIYRDVPGLATTDPVTVSSDDAPDDVLLQTSGPRETRIRIGDPDRTVTGRQYTIGYPLETLVEGDLVAWNGVGLRWEVPIDDAEIHLLAGRALLDPGCDRGGQGARGGCAMSSPSNRVISSSWCPTSTRARR